MAGVIYSLALGDFLRFRRVFVWILIACVLFGIGKVYLHFSSDIPVLQGYTLMTSTFVYRVVALSAAIFSTSVISQEVEGRTIVYLLTRPIPRPQILVFRTLAAMTAVFVVSFFSAFATSLAFFGVHNPRLGLDLLGIAVGAVAYTTFFMVVSLLINRAMVLCLLFAFGWELFVGNLSGDMRWLSINSYLVAIAHRPDVSSSSSVLDVVGGLLGSNTIPASVAWWVMVGFTLVLMGFGSYWFTTNEYIAREDGE